MHRGKMGGESFRWVGRVDDCILNRGAENTPLICYQAAMFLYCDALKSMLTEHSTLLNE